MSDTAPSASIEEIRPEDVGAVAACIHTEATGAPPPDAALSRALEEHLRWVLADNPSNIAGVPWGWLLRSEDRAVVGAMVCVPMRVRCQDWSAVALMSAKWFVNVAYRGAGLGLFLRYLKLGRSYPLFATTAGAQSSPLWIKFGGYPISESDHELVGALRLGPLLEEAVHRKLRSRPLARGSGLAATLMPSGLRSARRAGAGVTIDRLTSADQAAAFERVGPEDVISAVRDRAYLHWRYFSGPQADTREVLACTMPSGRRALAVTTVATRGYRAQVRTLSVLDLWGNIAPDEHPALAGALARRAAGACDAVVLRSLSAQAHQSLLGSGFVRRAFPQPTTWCIDKAGLAPTRSWYLVPGDAE